MKKLTLLILLAPIFFGCSNADKNAEKNSELIANYVKAVENLDYDAMDLYLADNYLGMGPSFGDSIGKDQAIESWKSNVANLYEGIKYSKSRIIPVTISEGPNQGEWVSNWALLDITYKNGEGQVTIWANSIYKIENGKIVQSLTFYNEADAYRQMGYVFYNPNDL